MQTTLVSSAKRTCSSLSAAASWLREIGAKPSIGSFFNGSWKKKLMISSWTLKDIACAISYATPRRRSALWTSSSVERLATISGSLRTALIAPLESVFHIFKPESSFRLFTSCDLEVHFIQSTYLIRPSSTHCAKVLIKWREGSNTFAMTKGCTLAWIASRRWAIPGGGSFLGASCFVASTFLRRSAALRVWLSKKRRRSFGELTWSSRPKMGTNTPSMNAWSSPVPGFVATEKAKVACVTQPLNARAFTVAKLNPMARALLSNTALLSTSDVAAI